MNDLNHSIPFILIGKRAYHLEKKIKGKNMTENKFNSIFPISKEQFCTRQQIKPGSLFKKMEQKVNRRLGKICKLQFTRYQIHNHMNFKMFTSSILKCLESKKRTQILNFIKNQELLIEKYFNEEEYMSITEKDVYRGIQLFLILKIKKYLEDLQGKEKGKENSKHKNLHFKKYFNNPFHQFQQKLSFDNSQLSSIKNSSNFFFEDSSLLPPLQETGQYPLNSEISGEEIIEFEIKTKSIISFL